MRLPPPPTVTMWTLPSKEAGVGAGELGYEPYTVVQVDDASVIVAVTVSGPSVDGGGVTLAGGASVVAGAAAVEEAAAADADRAAP